LTQEKATMTQRVEDNKDLDSRRECSAAAWAVAIDESDNSEGWQIEIDSPHIYLTFQVADLAIIRRGVELLQLTLTSEDARRCHEFVRYRDEVALGYFNGTAVHLLRDNEDFPRCFLVIGPTARSTLRLSLEEGDIPALPTLPRRGRQ
jgi:hypothetical protein